MRKYVAILMILGVASISQAVMLADFETGTDGFVPTGTTTSILATDNTTTAAITSGAQCLKIIHKPTNYWPIQWQAPSVPTRLGKLQVDVTLLASEWPTQPWSRFCEKISLTSDGAGGGWAEYSTSEANWTDRNTGETTSVDWGAWDGDCIRTLTIDISDYDLTGATYFSINFSFNCGTEGPYYLDNLHFVDEPYNPNPTDGGLGGLLTDLSWNNAVDDANSITVWFAETPVEVPTDPNTFFSLDTYKNLLDPVYTEINPGATSICPNANLPTLVDGQEYTWCVETDPNTIPVLFWTFTATINEAPIADAGADQDLYGDPNTVATLDGSASSDDGLIAPLTYTWTQTAGPTVTIDSPNAATTTVTLPEIANSVEYWNAPAADAYVFELTVDDGQAQDTDSVTVTLSTDSCVASVEAGGFYFYGDIASAAGAGYEYRDCKVDLYDFAELALNWLGCSNTFEACP